MDAVLTHGWRSHDNTHGWCIFNNKNFLDFQEFPTTYLTMVGVQLKTNVCFSLYRGLSEELNGVLFLLLQEKKCIIWSIFYEWKNASE